MKLFKVVSNFLLQLEERILR